jgi:hypothetical protein
MEPNVSNISCPGHKSIQVCKSQEKRPSAARENPFSSYESSKRAKGWLSAAEIHQQSKSTVIGFSGLSSCPDLARRVAPIVQGKSGSSDPIGTGGGQSAYRGSVFRETWSLPFFTAEIADRRNAESTFGAEPTVLAPGHIKRACKWGQPPL